MGSHNLKETVSDAILKRQTIKATFSKFGLELTDECELDSLSIYDGSNSQSPLIGKYCGPRLPQELIQSTGPAMFMLFVSDEADSGFGFNISWTSGMNSRK
jgi:cubilin